MNTQTDRILRYLKSGRSLTPIGALSRFRCFRLAARVRDLRRAGVSVKTQMVKRGGKSYASYRWS